MADSYADKIKTARDAGYSDDEILFHLGTTDLGDKVKTAQSAGYNPTEILKHLETAQTTTPSPNPTDMRGASGSPTHTQQAMDIGGAALTMGKDALEGFGSGVISTGVGAYNLVRKGVSAVGLGNLPEAPQFLQEAGSSVQHEPGVRDAQGRQIPKAETSNSFQAGRVGEQVGEFMIPGGTIGKIGKAAEAASGFGKVGGAVARIGTTAALDSAATGAISAVQTGGDFDKAANDAISQGISTGAFGTIGGLLSAIPMNKFYAQGLQIPKRFHGQQTDDIIDKAISEGILISAGGADKIRQIENLEKGSRDAAIQKLSADYLATHGQPLTVDFKFVEAPVQRMREMADRMGETGIVNQIDKRLDRLSKANGGTNAIPPVPGTPGGTRVASGPSTGAFNPQTGMFLSPVPGTPGVPGVPAKAPQIPIDDAIQLKNDFQAIAKNFFGKASAGPGEIRKLLSAGLNDAISDISPAYREANRDIQNSKILKQAIDAYVTNPNNGFLANPRAAMLVFWNQPAAVMYGALASPYVRSALAIINDRASKAIPIGGRLGGRVAAGASNAGVDVNFGDIPVPPEK